MPIFRYPFFYNNYRNYYNRPIPYGSNNNLHINNEYRPENFESKPQENPNKPLEEKKLNDDNIIIKKIIQKNRKILTIFLNYLV